LIPIESQPSLCCAMSIIVVRMQVLAGGRNRFMPQIVPHVSQIDLAIHHARARRVSQPIGGRLPQSFRCAFVRFVRRLQMSDGIVEYLFDDQVQGAACHCSVGATDRQQQRCRFTTIGEGSEIVVSAIARKLRHEFGRRRQQAFLVALAGDRQPPAVLGAKPTPGARKSSGPVRKS